MSLIQEEVPGFNYPPVQINASRMSGRFQKINFNLIGLNLAVLVLAALLSKYPCPTLKFQYLPSCLLVVGLACTVLLAKFKPDRVWYAARSLSETSKTLSWRFVMNASPFDGVENNSKILLEERFLQASAVSNDLVGSDYFKAELCTSDALLEVKNLPLDDKIQLYVSKRISNQHNWYGHQARKNRILSRLFFGLLCVSNIAAIIFSVFQDFTATSAPMPTDVLTALAGAIIAWNQARKFDELSAAYELTSHEISLLRKSIFDLDTELNLSEFVAETESLFSREHTQWGAKRA